ncbi:MAG: hypothetical protein R3C56_24505 [Pirellulaceae bacterium]
MEYDGYKPVRIDTVVVSTQHGPTSTMPPSRNLSLKK